MLTSEEQRFLEALAWDLHGSFSLIAYAGYHSNDKFIRERQKYLQKTYNSPVKKADVIAYEGILLERLLDFVDSDFGVYEIIPAFEAFQDLLKLKPDNRIQEAIEQLEFHLNPFVSGDMDYEFLSPGIFSRYSKLSLSEPRLKA